MKAVKVPGLGFPVVSVSNPSRGTPARMVAAGEDSALTCVVDGAPGRANRRMIPARPARGKSPQGVAGPGADNSASPSAFSLARKRPPR